MLVLVLLVALVSVLGVVRSFDGPFGGPPPRTPIVLPRDDAFRITPVQWWYYTGHLSTTGSATPSKTFGFEFCFFIVEGIINLVQVAVTDVEKKTFQYTEDLQPEFDLDKMNITTGTFELASQSGAQVAKGGDGVDMVRFTVGDYSVALDLQSTKPPAMHYDGHAHPYAFGGWTYYYSRTGMSAVGTISLQSSGETLPVTGTSWFDRQWGDLAKAVLQGWQWFAIELGDNTQVMLFDFIGDASEKYGSVTWANGTTSNLAASQFTVSVLKNWTSPKTGCTYPAQWAVTVLAPDGSGSSSSILSQPLLVTPKVANQELRVLDSPTYWEGASYVQDAATGSESLGQAYVELNGYCPKF